MDDFTRTLITSLEENDDVHPEWKWFCQELDRCTPADGELTERAIISALAAYRRKGGGGIPLVEFHKLADRYAARPDKT